MILLTSGPVSSQWTSLFLQWKRGSCYVPKVFSAAFSRAFTGQIVRRKDSIAADGLLNRNLKSETSRDKAHHSKQRADVSRSTIIYLLIPHDWKQRACVFGSYVRAAQPDKIFSGLVKYCDVWGLLNIVIMGKCMSGLADSFKSFSYFYNRNWARESGAGG